MTPFRRFTETSQCYTFTSNVADPSKAVRIALAFTDYPSATPAYDGQVNNITMYALQGNSVYCDGGPYDTFGHSVRSGMCPLPDLSNNVKLIDIAPNSFSGSFQLQINANGINAKAVPGLDGVSNNQAFGLWVYNVTF